MKDIKLSIVVLVYNTSEFLEQCFDSLINQTLNSIEIIAVDDESTDNSLEICKNYENKYENFRVVTQKNQGGAVAGTTGMKQAKGKYIALVDSDDFLPLDAYETLYNLCEENSSDIAIGKPLRYVNNQFLEMILPEENAVWEENKYIKSFDELKYLFHDRVYWNKIYKRDFVEKYDIYMPAGFLYADFLMVHKAYEYANGISLTNKIVYYWRRHDAARKVKSASQVIADCDNFKQRISSLLYLKTNNENVNLKMEEAKLIQLSFVVNSIKDNYLFRQTFLEYALKVLNDSKNLENNELHPLVKLKLWLLKKNYIVELFTILFKPPQIKLLAKNDKIYCNLPFFEHEHIKVPNEIYEYNRFRPEFIKNFLYIDNGKNFTFQVLLHHVNLLEDRSKYYLFFKNKFGETLSKYELLNLGDYYFCEINKNDILKEEKVFLKIGNDDNIIYGIKKGNCEPTLINKKSLNYIFWFDSKNELYIETRNIKQTIRKKLLKK